MDVEITYLLKMYFFFLESIYIPSITKSEVENHLLKNRICSIQFHLVFTCSKLAVERLEQGAKYVQY